MTDAVTARLECLRLASQLPHIGSNADAVVDAARKFADFALDIAPSSDAARQVIEAGNAKDEAAADVPFSTLDLADRLRDLPDKARWVQLFLGLMARYRTAGEVRAALLAYGKDDGWRATSPGSQERVLDPAKRSQAAQTEGNRIVPRDLDQVAKI